jgi:arylformamidase
VHWLDISFPIREAMAGFPGDPPVQITPVRTLAQRDPYNLSALAMGSHTGTHVDPPNHFLAGGVGIDRVDLARLNGPCTVVELPPDVVVVDRAAVERYTPPVERLVFRTSNSARWAGDSAFFEDYVAVDTSGARALLDRKVRLVGIDSLSVERDPSGTFPAHTALLGGGALILEGLRLEGVRAGNYELRCLPLRILNGDGGPCRAALLAA